MAIQPNTIALTEDLARQENRLWAIARGTNGEPHLDQLPGGDDAINKVIDPYFVDHPNATRADLLRDHPEVGSFLDANPRAAEYVDQYGRIAQSSQTLHAALVNDGVSEPMADRVSAAVIRKVDARYNEGGPGGEGFDAAQIAHSAFTSVQVDVRETTTVSRGAARYRTGATIDGVTVEEIRGSGDFKPDFVIHTADGKEVSVRDDGNDVVTIGDKTIHNAGLHRQIMESVSNILGPDKDGTRRFSLQEAHDVAIVATAAAQTAERQR